MDVIEIYSLIAKDLAEIPYSRSVSNLAEDLVRLGWHNMYGILPMFFKDINDEFWYLCFDENNCLEGVHHLGWGDIGFLQWAGKIYYDIALNGSATLVYPAPEEVFCDQVAMSVLRCWIPEHHPKPLSIQEVHESFEKFTLHTKFTNLKQIHKVLCMLATHSFEPFPESGIPIEKGYLQADIDSDIDDICAIYSGWVESLYVKSNLSFTSIQMLKYMRDSWFIPEDCGECLRLLSLT